MVGCRWLSCINRLSWALNWPFRPGPRKANVTVLAHCWEGSLRLLLPAHHTAAAVVVRAASLWMTLIKLVANTKQVSGLLKLNVVVCP